MVSHPDDLIIGSISSGWHNGIWTLSHPDELAPVRISSGWLLDTAVCHPDDISYHRMSSGWLSRNWYLIRMSYDNVIMSSGWHRLPFLSHPDEIANFDFPHHAVALQRFRNLWNESHFSQGLLGLFRYLRCTIKAPTKSWLGHWKPDQTAGLSQGTRISASIGRNLVAKLRHLRRNYNHLEECVHIDGSVQERRNSIANALELRLSCTKPSISAHKLNNSN